MNDLEMLVISSTKVGLDLDNIESTCEGLMIKFIFLEMQGPQSVRVEFSVGPQLSPYF